MQSQRKTPPQPTRKHHGIVIFNETLGVFLGVHVDAVFWSSGKNSQDTAPVFDDLAAAQAFINKTPVMAGVPVLFINVIPDIHHGGQRYASPQACIQAGLPGWLSALSAAQHTMVFGVIPTVH